MSSAFLVGEHVVGWHDKEAWPPENAVAKGGKVCSVWMVWRVESILMTRILQLHSRYLEWFRNRLQSKVLQN